MVDGKARILERVGGAAPDLRERRPSAESWSMVDVIEHLVLVEQGTAAALAKPPTPGRAREMPRGQWLRFQGLRVALKTGIRIEAPIEAVLPRRELPWHALLSRWEERRRELEEWLLMVDPSILGTPRFRHPIAGWLDVPQSLTFIGDHLAHHIPQLDRIERRIAS